MPSDRSPPGSAGQTPVIEEAPVIEEGQGAARGPDGRWAEGYCPNPNGRPRKAKPLPQDALRQVLDEKLPGAQGAMTLREGLIRPVCIRGLKEPRIALAVLKLDLGSPAPAVSDGDLAAEEEAIFAAYLAREFRRRGGGDEP